MNIGEYVLRAKDARGMTLDQISELTGIRVPHLSRMINDPPASPSRRTVEKIAAAFQVQPIDIWRAISDEGPVRPMELGELLSARVGPYVAQLPADKQERAIRALERTAKDYAEFASH